MAGREGVLGCNVVCAVNCTELALLTGAKTEGHAANNKQGIWENYGGKEVTREPQPSVCLVIGYSWKRRIGERSWRTPHSLIVPYVSLA